jgi:F0F1-type ATP synthase membrane subunit b/b'
MEFSINPDYIQFKNEILKDIREFEKRITEQMKMKHNSYDSILSDVKERLEKIEKDSKASTLSIIEIKSKMEPFNELLTYKQNLDSNIYSQEMRIKVALDEVYRLKSKYDKLINDNLVVPGLVGGSYRFKNLRDYINFNTMEISKVKTWQEDQKRLVAEFKKKLDNMPTTMENMVDSAVKQSNEINEQLHKDNSKKMEDKLEEFNKRILEIRAEVSNNLNLYEEKQSYLNEQINNFANIKTDILDTIDEKLKKVKEKEKDKEKLKKF